MAENLDRAGLTDDLVAAVAALGLTGAPTVAEHQGDERIFNELASFPFVGVRWDGGRSGELLEEGAITYQPEARFSLLVQTADPDPASPGPGYLEALAILDELERGLQGVELRAGHRLRWLEEEPELAFAGLYQYRQTWLVEPLISHA